MKRLLNISECNKIFSVTNSLYVYLITSQIPGFEGNSINTFVNEKLVML